MWKWNMIQWCSFSENFYYLFSLLLLLLLLLLLSIVIMYGQMLHYDQIHTSEEKDINKTNDSHN